MAKKIEKSAMQRQIEETSSGPNLLLRDQLVEIFEEHLADKPDVSKVFVVCCGERGIALRFEREPRWRRSIGCCRINAPLCDW
jgi:hypothetical protein